VVFDLKVQAAQEPRCYAAASGKVHCSFNLMYLPTSFRFASVVSGQRKLRLLDAVRQLKYNAQHLGVRLLNLRSMRPGNCQQDRALFERLQVVLERAIEHEQMTVGQINCLLGQL